MRYILLIFVTVFFIKSIYAQEPSLRQGYFNKTKIAIAIRTNTSPSNKKEGNGTEITTINGFHLNNKLSLGLGISATSYINPTVSTYPVFANVHYYIKDTRKTPFIFGNLGYNIPPSNSYKGGVLMEVGGGYNLKLGKKIALTPELSYKYQDFKFKASDGKLALSSISMGIGLLF